MKARRALALGDRAQPPPQPRITGRSIDHAAQQPPEIHAAAAGDDRQPAAGADIGHQAFGFPDVVRHVEIEPRIDAVDEMMGNAGALLLGWLGRGDIEAAVDLQGVTADDLAVQLLGNPDRQFRFAGAGRAEDRQQAQAFLPGRYISPLRT